MPPAIQCMDEGKELPLGCGVIPLGCASTSFTFVVSLNKRQIVDHDHANNYGRPELFDCDFSVRMARFSR